MANVYYVSTTGNPSTGTGTIGNPFRYIKDGVAAATSSGGVGDTVFLRGGPGIVYNHANDIIDSATFTVPSGTSAGYGSTYAGMIKIEAFPGERVIIEPPDGYHAIRLTTGGPHHLSFKDLEIDGINNTTTAIHGGVEMVYLSDGAHHNRFLHCEVRNNSSNGYSFSTQNGSADYNEIVGGSIHDNGRLDSGNSGYGMYLKSSNNLMDGVDIYGNNGYGIHINTGSGEGNDNVFTHCAIHENFVHGASDGGGSTSYGIVIINGSRNLIKNNLIYGNQGGILIYNYAADTLIYSNTIAFNLGHGGGGESAIDLQYYRPGTIIRNNIIFGNTTNAIVDYGWTETVQATYTGSHVATGTSPSPGDFTCDHNLFTDPDFVDDALDDFTDFAVLTGSDAIGAGMNLYPDVADDWQGTTRSSTPTIGAFEHVSGSPSASASPSISHSPSASVSPSSSVSHSPSRSQSPSASVSPSASRSSSPSRSPSPSSSVSASASPSEPPELPAGPFSAEVQVYGLDSDPDAPAAPDWIPVDDISVEQRIRHSRGINGTTPTDALAGTGELSCSAFNDEHNSIETRGAYSIGHPSARLGWTDGAPTRVVYTYNDVDYVAWRGKLADVDPDTNYDEGVLADVVAYDHQHDLVEADVVEIDGQYQQTDAALVGTLLNAVPSESQPPDRNLSAAQDTYTFALYDVQPNTKCATALKDVLVSGFHLGSCDREGTFQFISRLDRFTRAPIGSLDSTMLTALSAGTRSDERVSCVKCGYHPLLQDDTDVVLFEQDNAFEVGPGEIYEDFTPYRNPDQVSQTIGKRSTVAVEATTDWLANEQEDGTGLDITSSVTVTRTDRATYAKWRFDNSANAFSAWITRRQVRGKGLYDELQPFVQSDSTQPYGRKVYPLDLKYQDNCKTATGIAELIRSQLEVVGIQSARAEFLANDSDALMLMAITAEVGDTVNITNENTGLVTQVMEIRRIEHEIEEGTLLWVRWDLALSTDLTQTPSAPTGLSVSVQSDTELLVQWTNTETTQTEILVDGFVRATVAPGATQVIINGLVRATNYAITARHIKFGLIISAETAPQIGRPRVIATGGTESDVVVDGITYHQHVFLTSAVLQRLKAGRISRMLVGGAGGGGSSDAVFIAGGGGGGGEVLIVLDNQEPVGTDTVTVGAGGVGGVFNSTAADEGSDTTYRLDTALGGGAGGSVLAGSPNNGTSRGTGGGGTGEGGLGGVGNLGGDGGAGGVAGAGYRTGGGVGGAGGNGAAGVEGGSGSAVGGDGGASVTFWGFTAGQGGKGGGPAGGSGADGSGYGFGGDGGLNADGGDGDDGFAVFRYPI